MGCSPSKVGDGAAAQVSHPVVKPAVERVVVKTQATKEQVNTPTHPDLKFGNTKKENEAACKVQSVYRGHAARKRVEVLRTEKEAKVSEGQAKDAVTPDVPEEKEVADEPTSTTDNSAAAVAQIFGEEGANAVAAAFFDGNGSLDHEDVGHVPDQNTNQASDMEPTEPDVSQEAPMSLEALPEASPAHEETAVVVESGETQDGTEDRLACIAVDAAASEEPCPAPRIEAAQTDHTTTENDTPAEDVATDTVESPVEAPDASDTVEFQTDGAVEASNDAAELEHMSWNEEQLGDGVEVETAEASPEAESILVELNADAWLDDVNPPGHDTAAEGIVAEDAEGAGEAEPAADTGFEDS